MEVTLFGPLWQTQAILLSKHFHLAGGRKLNVPPLTYPVTADKASDQQTRVKSALALGKGP